MTIAEFMRQLKARIPGCEAINIRFAASEIEISIFLADIVYPFLVDNEEWNDLPAMIDDLVVLFELNAKGRQ